MPLPRAAATIFLAAALMLSPVALIRLPAQMQACAPYKGELLPIVTCTEHSWMVLKDGEKTQVEDYECHIRPGTAFAEGFVELKDVRADLDPLRDAKPEERANSGGTRFHYQANLVADRSMSDCYAILSFVTEGSVGTKLIPLGRLAAGKPKSIEVKLPSRVDAVGSVHVFFEGLEVKSTEHREPYDVLAYYAALVKDVRGLSATELLKSEDDYAHRLSADGRLLAVLRLREAKKILIIYDLESMKLICEAPVTDSDGDVIDLTWVSDHEVVYITKQRLDLLDTQSGKTRELRDDADRIITALIDKPEILVIYHRGLTEKYDIRSGKKFDEKRLKDGLFAFDREGNDRVRIEYDDDKINYFFRAKPGQSWQALDSAVKQPGLRFNVQSAQMLDRVVDVHSVGPDGDTLYVSTRLDGADRFELAAYSLSAGVIKRIIARHPRYDLTTIDGGKTRLLFAKDSPKLLGMVYEAQKPEVVWLDPHYAAVQKSLDQMFPGNVNLPVDWSRDGRTFIFFSSSEQDPGTFYVFKPEESRLIPVLELGERLKGKSMARTEAIEFTARDGEKIPAYITRPPVAGSEPAPLIVHIHGGPMARDNWGFSATNQFFASRGYIVLQVNYRGSSGFGAKFQNAGLGTRLDTVVLDDIADGVRYLINRKEVDPARVAVMGGTFGGWATYMSLIKYPELYHAGIAIAAVANWRKFIHDDQWTFENKFAFTFWKSLLNRADFAANEKFIDPYLRAAEIKQPLFIIHGKWDTVVSPIESGMMLAAVKKTNPNVQSHSFPNATHTYWSFADRVVMLNEISVFLDRYLGKLAAGGVVRAAP